MNRFITLVKREYWENRNVFVTIPLIFSVIIILFVVGITVLTLFTNHASVFFHMNDPNANIGVFVSRTFFLVSFPFAIILWLVLFNYFLTTLYTERKDGSILFWQSMPVTQTETIISKWFVGLIVAPITALLVTIVTGLVVLALVSIIVWNMGGITPWMLWSGTHLFVSWAALFVAFLMQGFWLFPLLAWCLFCSAFSNKSPFLRAVLVPLMLILLEFFIDKQHYVLFFVKKCFVLAMNAWGQVFEWLGGSVVTPVKTNVMYAVGHHYAGMSVRHYTIFVVLSVGLGLLFTILAGWIRSRCYGYER